MTDVLGSVRAAVLVLEATTSEPDASADSNWNAFPCALAWHTMWSLPQSDCVQGAWYLIVDGGRRGRHSFLVGHGKGVVCGQAGAPDHLGGLLWGGITATMTHSLSTLPTESTESLVTVPCLGIYAPLRKVHMHRPTSNTVQECIAVKATCLCKDHVQCRYSCLHFCTAGPVGNYPCTACDPCTSELPLQL